MNVKLAIAGASGRMGRALITAASGDARCRLVGGTVRSGSPELGQDLGSLVGQERLGAVLVDDAAEAAEEADVWIDFTTPDATVTALADLSGTKVRAAIIGTTGCNGLQLDRIKAASGRLAVVMSGNFSLGVNVLAGLVRQAAARLGPDWDIEICESHHRAKVDAPSGTALMLGRAAAAGRGVDHDEVAAFARHGQTGPRKPGDIGYAVIRGGQIIGNHDVMFAHDDEIIHLSHAAQSRTLFAQGALVAARWAVNQPPGLYAMEDVLGF